ncbi:hypothetical protein HanRHA438_Chr06g0265111 [Helianthus annuus]|uniref:Uncharacterized protein n=1 Tax=Helianthus annuus TaxID=4232 RepID=A0A9K3NIT6_HELAN|nr:hypothetical protein HanXRQr2_Chr06g0255851 [Helianthus annuus]KAJ0566596.1 hypothetical protein HanIR_Chr06g0275421 [Helianthus annuus]KAJ0573321.1 hypothetical protein HanHA89_Chr06g0225431 [Helianthus annuus]KAJ0911619.1 hypothetical protein HanRHA438_Chr06g0265111 [Helianthus annuus]
MGVEAGKDKGKADAESGSSSDSDDIDIAAELNNDDLDEDDVAEGIVEDWKLDDEIADKFNFVETGKGKSIEYMLDTIPGAESVAVNIDDLRGYVFGDALPDKIPNPVRVPEEVRQVPRKWLKPLLDQIQKKRYVNTKRECSGQIRSWDFDKKHSLIMIKRMDGVQYFRPRVKYLQTLPACDLHYLAQFDLNNHTNVGSIRSLIPHLEAESRNTKWKKFKPTVGRAVKSKDKFTGKQVLKMVYKPARCQRKIPMRKFDLDKIQGSSYWYVDGRLVKRSSREKKFLTRLFGF